MGEPAGTWGCPRGNMGTRGGSRAPAGERCSLGTTALLWSVGLPGCQQSSNLAQADLTRSGYSLFPVRWLHSSWTMFT